MPPPPTALADPPRRPLPAHPEAPAGAGAGAGVDALARLVALRDRGTSAHSDEVAELSLAVGRALGLGPATLVVLERAARLHDLGKIAIPDRILWKPAALDDGEWELMRHHPAWGSGTVEIVPGLRAVAEAIRWHHERWDGTGYPDGLRGEAIPVESRVIAVCDAYSAMTAQRPYAPARDGESALAELRRCAGRQFDPGVVDALVGALRLGVR